METLGPRSERPGDQGLLAPPGTYDKLRSLIGESESGIARVGRFRFERYLLLSTPRPDMIMVFHKVREGKKAHPYLSSHIHILDSDKVVRFDTEHSDTGRKLSSQQDLDEALAEIDRTIETGKLFR